jgi:hypothetical protein
MAPSLSTAAAARIFIFVGLTQVPTDTLALPYPEGYKHPLIKTSLYHSDAPSVARYDPVDSSSRATTAQESTIGTLRNWRVFDSNWDGEGAAKPCAESIREAVSFVRLLPAGCLEQLDPMLLASGHTALFWNANGLYADIEFLGDQRIAYFVKKNLDKHKGVVSFDQKTLPVVLKDLLGV